MPHLEVHLEVLAVFSEELLRHHLLCVLGSHPPVVQGEIAEFHLVIRLVVQLSLHLQLEVQLEVLQLYPQRCSS